MQSTLEPIHFRKNIIMKKLILVLLPVLVLMAGCKSGLDQKYAAFKKAEPANQAEIDQNIIVDHLIENGLDLEKTASGIFYTIEKEGEGISPTTADMVTTHYEGTFLDGKKFDSSYDKGAPATFPLGGVIKGWQEAIPLLKPGGKGTFFIPSGIAYGPKARAPIPANAILKFKVELIEIFDPEAQKVKDEAAIQAYLKENALKTEKTPSGIHYIIKNAGKGVNPIATSTVKVNYAGTLLDGTEFDSSYNAETGQGNPVSFPLTRVIPGWTEGIPLFKEGGSGQLIIPSGLAYGPYGRPKIPANSPLIFEVELLEIVKPAVK